jgi:NADH-quinone oxidoreductase subunit H
MKLGFYLFAEYINMFVSSAVMATLYFGAYNYPGMDALLEMGVDSNIVNGIGVLAMFMKVFIFIFIFMWIRWTVPRFRYDQLMRLGWNILIPLAIANIVITGLWIMYV